MDYGNNVKQGDGDINNFLYSPEDNKREQITEQQYNLPADPGSGPSYMKQPMNRPQSSGLRDAGNAGEKMAMLNKLKEQQRAQYERKKTQFSGVGQRSGVLNLGGALTLEDMNLDRKAEFEGDAFDPFNIGNSAVKHNLQLSAQNAYFDKNNS
jgi:hypothetical protein